MNYKTAYESPLGKIVLVSDGKYLTELLVDGENISTHNDLEVFHKTKEWLDCYFAGKRPQIADLPLAPRGSAFCQRVWNLLKEIPYGEVVTYGELAKIIAKERQIEKMSAQAIGQAVGRNPLPIIIPCHRVIGANNQLTGYSGGIDKKIWLLRHESHFLGTLVQ